MNNPLTPYYKIPKLYVKLPSKAQFYQADMLDLTPNGEIPVYAMSAMDQITIRTPDALLNGDAMVKVVGNCVPNIRNPKQLVEPDINTLLVAIRIATSGDVMEVKTNCPNCEHENEFQVSLTPLLETQTELEEDTHVEFDGSLLIHLKPFDFEQRNLTLLNEIQEAQAVNQIQNNSDMDITTKYTNLGAHMEKMAERTFDIVAKSIKQITILKTGEVVTNTQNISEWLKGIPKSQADIITQKIKQLNKVGIDTDHHFVCQSCNHAWDQTIDFDPASFFV